MEDKNRIQSDGHREGTSTTRESDGTIHETRWYGNDHSSARTSRDHRPDGTVENEHTTKQK